MLYTYYFEIAAIILLGVVLYDYKNKMKVFRTDAVLFREVIYTSLLESGVNLLSCMMLENADIVPVIWNIAVATIFFVVQALKIYMIVSFSCTYINPRFSKKDPFFYLALIAFLANVALSVSSLWTHAYFRIDAAGHYQIGRYSVLGFSFYLINILICLVYALIHRKRLPVKDLQVAAWIAVIIGCGVSMQYLNRGMLVIGFSVALAVLYLYLTLENPNDYQDKVTLRENAYGFKVQIDHNVSKGKRFSVIFVDSQKFRYVNSIYGEEMGDYVLRQIAVYLENIFEKRAVFRIHNDLFAVIVDEPQEEMYYYIGKITRKFEYPWMLPEGEKVQLRGFMAVCEYPTYFQSHTELLKLADAMMKTMKESHDRNVMYCDEKLADRCKRSDSVEQALNRSMDQKTLQIYFQPIFDEQAGEIVALEALSRLQDPELGAISPLEFVPIAERSGQIIRMGFYVMERVCEFMEEELLSNPHNQVTCVHVNLSMLQCAYDQLKNQFQEIMERHHVPTQMIQLELTESTMLESPDMVQKTMKELVDYGLLFALDDYGTGYSNISYLIQFPFAKIKFDKNMVWSYFEQENARKIMANEFQILQDLGKDIVVEGIETKEQYEEMRDQGIRFFQGYYFSKPLPAKECAEFLNQGKRNREK